MKINNRDILLGEVLKEKITPQSRIQMVAANFTLDAFEVLREELEKIDELKFIFSSPNYLQQEKKKQYREYKIFQDRREKALYGNKWKIASDQSFNQRRIAKECAQWIKEKATFRSVNTDELAIDKGVKIYNSNEEVAIKGMESFTLDELGYGKPDKLPRSRNLYEYPNSQDYLDSFDDYWDNNQFFKDVTQQVVDKISVAFEDNSPEFLYYVTLYHIFKDFLEDINEDYQPNDDTGFKNTKIWNMLYPFQKDAVQSIIAKLEQYNGCILADSVGLGKTFTALGVITYYLKRNKDVLVLCPKKLENNWNQYTKNYKGNPFAEERLHYDVLYHTDLSRKKGKSNGMQLDQINWENYDLVVIDESHNFRNGGVSKAKEEEGKENRYDRLLNKVIRTGKKTKVLMLSATPVNNRFSDLKNQLALAYEGASENLEKELNIEGTIDTIFRNAQAAYNEWSKLSDEKRTSESLLEKLDFDFFTLLDSVTIARSRKHIMEFYNTEEIGDFPIRRLPVNLSPSLTNEQSKVDYEQIYDLLKELNLLIYNPMKYVHKSKRYKYETQRHGRSKSLTREGREEGTKKLMQINLLKRLESSIYAFNKTVESILEKINSTLRTINEFEHNHISQNIDDLVSQEIVDELDDDELRETVGNDKTPIALEDMNYIDWQKKLLKDQMIFEELLSLTQSITPEKDAKLQTLYQLIDQKIQNPINDENKKVLIFSAFADTANYLYAHVSQYVHRKYGLHVGRVSGSDRLKSTTNEKNIELNQMMCYFSPQSKHCEEIYGDKSPEIDILIATDVISEGQNLQDCDMVVNYDIHWNPVRIVQRFGRVDRIGSKNKEIQLVNFWPNVELDKYIKLKERVEGRATAMNIVGTGDDNPLAPEDQNEATYRKKQLEKMQNEVIDLEDVNNGISIMDLGLDDYRMSLRSYLSQHPEIKKVPNGLYTVLPSDDANPPGAIFILKNIHQQCVDYTKNRLYPYYLIYISDDGEVVTNQIHSKELLSRLRKLCKDYHEPIESLYTKFNMKTDNGMDMKHYSDLLDIAILNIMEKEEEDEEESLFEQEELNLIGDQGIGDEDFELVSFFVIL